MRWITSFRVRRLRRLQRQAMLASDDYLYAVYTARLGQLLGEVQ